MNLIPSVLGLIDGRAGDHHQEWVDVDEQPVTAAVSNSNNGKCLIGS